MGANTHANPAADAGNGFYLFFGVCEGLGNSFHLGHLKAESSSNAI